MIKQKEFYYVLVMQTKYSGIKFYRCDTGGKKNKQMRMIKKIRERQIFDEIIEQYLR